MNRQMAEFMALEAKEKKFHHVHGAGVVGCRQMSDHLREAGVDLSAAPEIDVREYISNMGVLRRAGDRVTSRPGASTLREVTALAFPAIIGPSPFVANNHQEHNARVLSDAGGAELILEKDCSGALLYETACAILGDGKRHSAMREAMGALGNVDAAEKIYSAVTSLCKKR